MFLQFRNANEFFLIIIFFCIVINNIHFEVRTPSPHSSFSAFMGINKLRICTLNIYYDKWIRIVYIVINNIVKRTEINFL